jgi:GT2 family glycosyltransferase
MEQDAAQSSRPARATLSVVVLSFNRRDSLARTLSELESQGMPSDAQDATTCEVIVVDNASTDATPAMLAERFPRVRVLDLPKNIGIGGYNQGVRASMGEFVLLLDDDSWPDVGAIAKGLQHLQSHQDTAGVALLPMHPTTRASEWPFARTPRDCFPVMGCGNLVRRADWDNVRGYEDFFFLYRNDTDLALKLLGSRRNVYFDPAWIVWHDSNAAAKKTENWLRLATRNWIWMCKRHGRGLSGRLMRWLGVVQALRHAGWNIDRLTHVINGVLDARSHTTPSMPATVRADGKALRELMSLRLRG